MLNSSFRTTSKGTGNFKGTGGPHRTLSHTDHLVQIADEDVNVIAPFTNSQNDIFAQNERFSLIRWGSQVDLVLPLDDRFDFELCLEDAMHVQAGVDKLVRLSERL